MPCLITLSQKELRRLEAIQKIRDHRLSVVQAAELLHMSRSQVHRLMRAYAHDGTIGLVSKKRGQPSNRRFDDTFRNMALDLVRECYHDFGPTLAREKLIECHDIAVSKETLRIWMTEAGIWTSWRERRGALHQPRGRRDCFGELVQIDGSHHWWFEERGPKCALLVYIDDATGKLLHLRFAGSENTFDYLIATKAYLTEWGKPVSFYSDKHGVFRATHGSEKDRSSGLTQFGRALYELNIDIICANSPQAKGRVERANKTLQDRLVKEMRLRGISTVEEANTYACEFAADFNTRFGKTPRNPKDMHRPLASYENLDATMCRKEVRTLSQALTLQYDKVLFILDPTELAKSLAGKKVIVCDYPDGRLEIMEGSTSLPYRLFDKLRSVHRTPVVENKRLDEALVYTAAKQAGRKLQRSQRGPRRTGQSDHIFAIPDGSQSNGYQKRECKPGRRTDFMNDPVVNARRDQALARLSAAGTRKPSQHDAPALELAGLADIGTALQHENHAPAPEANLAGKAPSENGRQSHKSFKRTKISERWGESNDFGASSGITQAADGEAAVTLSNKTIQLDCCGPEDGLYPALDDHVSWQGSMGRPDLKGQNWEDYKNDLLQLDAIADDTLADLPNSTVEDPALTTSLLYEMKAQVLDALVIHCLAFHERFPGMATKH